MKNSVLVLGLIVLFVGAGAGSASGDRTPCNFDPFVLSGGVSHDLTNTPFVCEFRSEWSPLAQQIVYDDGGATVYVLPPRRGIRQGAVHATGSRPAESKVESVLFVRGDSIYSVRADGSRVRRLVRGSDPVWSPDGTRFAYEAQALHECGGDCLKVFVANADGTAKRRATDVPPGTLIQIRPAWSPDGTQIVFSDSALPPTSFGLAVATVGGSPKYITGDATSWDWGPAWSPDGSWICFARSDGLYLVTPRGTSTHRIVKGVADSPAWSPDGQTILFMRAHRDLYSVAPNGTTLLRIAAGVRSAAWSPNGMRIAVSGGDGIFTVNPGGSGRKVLTAGKQDRDAAWSPDGTLIAFQRHADVWLMKADGSHQHMLVRNGSASAWRPRIP